jgi:hypothetical protein
MPFRCLTGSALKAHMGYSLDKVLGVPFRGQASGSISAAVDEVVICQYSEGVTAV